MDRKIWLRNNLLEVFVTSEGLAQYVDSGFL
jgi:hypothetical protein